MLLSLNRVFFVSIENEEGSQHHSKDAAQRRGQTSNSCSKRSLIISEPPSCKFTDSVCNEWLKNSNDSLANKQVCEAICVLESCISTPCANTSEYGTYFELYKSYLLREKLTVFDRPNFSKKYTVGKLNTMNATKKTMTHKFTIMSSTAYTAPTIFETGLKVIMQKALDVISIE